MFEALASHLSIANEVDQVAFGKRLGRLVGRESVIFLEGDLGAGKTTLVRGFLQGRGHSGKVKSPTYTLIEPYFLASGSCYHLDLYRLVDAEELDYLGLRDILAESAVVLIEWPERASILLPKPDLRIQIAHRPSSEGRDIHLMPCSSMGAEVVSLVGIG